MVFKDIRERGERIYEEYSGAMQTNIRGIAEDNSEVLPNYGVATQLRTFRTESQKRFRRKAIPKYIEYEIIPVLVLLGKKVVKKEGNKYKSIGKKIPELVKEIPYERICVFDLNSIMKNKLSINIIKKISAVKNVWVEADVQEQNDLIDLLVAGVENIVIDISRINSIKNLESCAEISSNIILKLGCNGKGEIYSATENVSAESPRRTPMLQSIKTANDKTLTPDEIVSTAKNNQLDKIIISSADLELNSESADFFLKNGLKIYIWNMENKKISHPNISGILSDIREVLKWSN